MQGFDSVLVDFILGPGNPVLVSARQLIISAYFFVSYIFLFNDLLIMCPVITNLKPTTFCHTENTNKQVKKKSISEITLEVIAI